MTDTAPQASGYDAAGPDASDDAAAHAGVLRRAVRPACASDQPVYRAAVHLANGHDVIMPQMMTNVNSGELAVFESAAAAAKAEYCQILLIAPIESAVDRCMERAKGGDPRQVVVSNVIEENGGRDFVRKLHSQVTQFSAGRQPHAVIDCERLTVEQACDAVEAALRPAQATTDHMSHGQSVSSG